MKSKLILTMAITALLVVGPRASAAQAAPTAFMTNDRCFDPAHPVYGGTINLAGLEPNTQYNFNYMSLGGGGFPITSDGQGNVPGAGGVSGVAPFELTIWVWRDLDRDGLLDNADPLVIAAHFSVDQPCQDNVPVRNQSVQCQHDRWQGILFQIVRGTAFQNQGQCVQFVSKAASGA
jgi:hypothetical protein